MIFSIHIDDSQIVLVNLSLFLFLGLALFAFDFRPVFQERDQVD